MSVLSGMGFPFKPKVHQTRPAPEQIQTKFRGDSILKSLTSQKRIGD